MLGHFSIIFLVITVLYDTKTQSASPILVIVSSSDFILSLYSINSWQYFFNSFFPSSVIKTGSTITIFLKITNLLLYFFSLTIAIIEDVNSAKDCNAPTYAFTIKLYIPQFPDVIAVHILVIFTLSCHKPYVNTIAAIIGITLNIFCQVHIPETIAININIAKNVTDGFIFFFL